MIRSLQQLKALQVFGRSWAFSLQPMYSKWVDGFSR